MKKNTEIELHARRNEVGKRGEGGGRRNYVGGETDFGGWKVVEAVGRKTRSQSISRIAAKDVEPDNFS